MTKRQKEVFECLKNYEKFKTLQDIADYLEITQSTLKGHAGNVYLLEDVKNRTELLLKYA